jgi:DEAD/DEAH box helicase domain-containing protein
VVTHTRNPLFEKPTLILYDRVPNGVGLSEALFRRHHDLFHAALQQLDQCPCRAGCPSCIGPAADLGWRGKSRARIVLEGFLQ